VKDYLYLKSTQRKAQEYNQNLIQDESIEDKLSMEDYSEASFLNEHDREAHNNLPQHLFNENFIKTIGLKMQYKKYYMSVSQSYSWVL
jgi:hypothetical protein